MTIKKISHRITVILLSFFLFTSCSNEYSDEIAFYVSPQGNDSWSGTSKNKPFTTLQKARDEIRAMKRQGELPKPVTVYLRGGLYESSTHFLLRPEDSGTESCPVMYTRILFTAILYLALNMKESIFYSSRNYLNHQINYSILYNFLICKQHEIEILFSNSSYRTHYLL